jgi:DNA polymerase III epsilon subunit-like protein
MAWAEQPIHFVDFEGSVSSGILEYAVVTLHRGAVTRLQTRLCQAKGDVPPQDTAVHGLSAKDLAGEAPLADEWEYFAGLRETGPLAAHYAGAENSMLKSVWPYPRISPDFAQGTGGVAEWGPWIDSARLCAQFRPGLGSGRLEEIVVALGLRARLDEKAARFCPPARSRFHAAPYDALAGALLLLELGRDPAFAALTLRQMLAYSTFDPQKRATLTQTELF